MNLALGFVTEFGFDWSARVSIALTPDGIATVLQEKTKDNNCCGSGEHGLWPDRILIIENGEDGPIVSAHYHAGIDYPRESQGPFVDWKENHVTPEGL